MVNKIIKRPLTSQKPKLIFFLGEDKYFLSHRLPTANAALKAGFEIYVMCRDTGVSSEIEKLGFKFIATKYGREASGIIKLFLSIKEVSKTIDFHRPDVVQFIGVRNCLLGSLASSTKKSLITINSINGLGYLFSNKSITAVLLQKFVVLLLSFFSWLRPGIYFFQNADDKKQFIKNGIKWKKAYLIPGSGVDHTIFKASILPQQKQQVIVGMAGRILKIKGVFDLAEAMKLLLLRNLNVKLLLAGDIDPSNPSSLSIRELQSISEISNISVLGHVDDMADFWKGCHIAVLPSHGGEGVPMALLQAAAVGRPIITTDTNGNRDICISGENGFLISPKKPDQIADKIELLAKSPKLIKKMGLASSEYIFKHGLTSEDISAKLKCIYEEIKANLIEKNF